MFTRALERWAFKHLKLQHLLWESAPAPAYPLMRLLPFKRRLCSVLIALPLKSFRSCESCESSRWRITTATIFTTTSTTFTTALRHRHDADQCRTYNAES
jgi:hypothetical protein